MVTDGWGEAELRRDASYLSFASYDAHEFDGAITQRIIETYLGSSQARSVLSVGAGAAELETKMATRTDWNVRAIDIDQALVDSVATEDLPENLTVAIGDVREPAATGTYDVNLAFGSLQELVGTPTAGLRGIRDSLRPGGLSLVVVPNLRNMLRVVKSERILLDESTRTADTRLAYAELELENGDIITQYGFTSDTQTFDDESTDGLEFDPTTLTTLETLADRAGLTPANPGPLRALSSRSGPAGVPPTDIDGFELAVGNSYPVSVPVDPSVLVGEGVERPFQEMVESFDRGPADALASTIDDVGLARYRRMQARDPGTGPRADLYAFRREDSEQSH